MTVNTTASEITYLADGSTTQWSFSFPGVAPPDIHVFITDAQGNQVDLPAGTFTVTLNPPIDPNPTSIGGMVVYPIAGSPLAVGNALTIQRLLPAVQGTSLVNQGTLYPAVIEEALDYLTMLTQQSTAELGLAFKASPGDPVPLPSPPVAQRALQWAFFDANGNLVPAQTPGGSVAISAAMQPVVSASTLALARQLMGVSVPALHVTGTYVITNANERQIVALGGNSFYGVSIGVATGYTPTFWIFIFNEDTRGKTIAVDGHPSFILWPGQQIWIS